MLRCLVVLVLWIGLSAFHTEFPTHSADHTVTQADANKMLLCEASRTTGRIAFSFPDPATVDLGTITIQKTDNEAPLCSVKRADGGTIGDWKQLNLPMHGDTVKITDAGDKYLVEHKTQMPVYGLQGQHRSPNNVKAPNYRVDCSSRGAIIRYDAAQGNGNVYLPGEGPHTFPEMVDCLFPADGYRNGYHICVMAKSIPPGSGFFVDVYSKDAAIWSFNNPLGVEKVRLTEHGQVVCFDYDSTRYTIVSHFKPSKNLELINY